jgi:hypothetical protein
MRACRLRCSGSAATSPASAEARAARAAARAAFRSARSRFSSSLLMCGAAASAPALVLALAPEDSINLFCEWVKL